jgi:uncharacterized protein (TIGR03067 family)
MTLLTVGLVLGISQARADDKGGKEKLKGEWSLVSLERNGESEKVTEASDDYIKLKIEGNNLIYSIYVFKSFVEIKAIFAVDSSKKPKTIDITFKEGDKDGEVRKGLYELDGDILKICLGSPQASERPAEFKSQGDVLVFTYKRVKK